ncbi:MAG TPA: AAA family ATPase [Anaerolineales bacterium]|nr:AAA family ATPase [Anaerolineales bacterium]
MILFAGPPELDMEWSDQGVEGAFRFLNRVWRLYITNIPYIKDVHVREVKENEISKSGKDLRRKIHKTIKKVTEDVEERFHFNTAISSIMELINTIYKFDLKNAKPGDFIILREALDTILSLLNPFAPHITEELWELMGHKESLYFEKWPAYKEKYMEEEFRAKRAQWEAEHRLDEEVDANDIAEIVSQWTGIPVTQMLETEAEKLLHMEERLHERIVGQDEAIRAISDAIRRARSGLKDPRKPIGSFIFIGPSGVGKTELAKALAEFLFDDEDALVRIDMSEYREQHAVSRLFGAPPGYVGYEEGGQLTEAVRRRPYRVILFDEIEKAHPEVWNALLQILDEGRLTDGQGRTVDFRNTVLIMTSNLGTEFIRRSGSLGFLQPASETEGEDRQAKEKIEKALKATFRPEFLNRIDEIIMFSPLTQEDMLQIVDLQARALQERLDEQGLRLELTPEARQWLAEIGYDPNFGARPLQRAIQKHVEGPLAIRLLSGEFAPGDVVLVDKHPEQPELTFRKQATEASVPNLVEAEG